MDHHAILIIFQTAWIRAWPCHEDSRGPQLIMTIISTGIRSIRALGKKTTGANWNNSIPIVWRAFISTETQQIYNSSLLLYPLLTRTLVWDTTSTPSLPHQNGEDNHYSINNQTIPGPKMRTTSSVQRSQQDKAVSLRTSSMNRNTYNSNNLDSLHRQPRHLLRRREN